MKINEMTEAAKANTGCIWTVNSRLREAVNKYRVAKAEYDTAYDMRDEDWRGWTLAECRLRTALGSAEKKILLWAMRLIDKTS